MFSWIARIRLNLAARRYARRLGPRLRRDYGGGNDYTVGQLRTAVKKSRLPARDINIGFAAFLDEETFRTVTDKSEWASYEALRSLYFEWLPVRISSPPGNVPEDPNLTTASFRGWQQ